MLQFETRGDFMKEFGLKTQHVASLIGQGHGYSEASKLASMSRTTLYRLLEKPEFLALIEKCKNERLAKMKEADDRITFDIVSAVYEAKKTVIDLALNASSEGTRLSAAKFIIDRFEPQASVVVSTGNENTVISYLKNR